MTLVYQRDCEPRIHHSLFETRPLPCSYLLREDIQHVQRFDTWLVETIPSQCHISRRFSRRIVMQCLLYSSVSTHSFVLYVTNDYVDRPSPRY